MARYKDPLRPLANLPARLMVGQRFSHCVFNTQAPSRKHPVVEMSPIGASEGAGVIEIGAAKMVSASIGRSGASDVRDVARMVLGVASDGATGKGTRVVELTVVVAFTETV